VVSSTPFGYVGIQKEQCKISSSPSTFFLRIREKVIRFGEPIALETACGVAEARNYFNLSSTGPCDFSNTSGDHPSSE
jgi:hypothetical protein